MARKRKGEDLPLHEQLPPVDFTARGAEDDLKNQANLLAAKQSEAYLVAGGLIAHALTQRGERVMLEYAQAGVGVKYEVDGVWMNTDPRDRQTSDAMLSVFKKIANLNVDDRRSRQDGEFGAEFERGKYNCTLTSQGVKTGERVLIRIAPKKSPFPEIEDLGIREGMRARFKELIDQDSGFVILSTPPGGGLSTMWNRALSLSDRFVRDFVALEDSADAEEEIINVGQIFYDGSKGETPAEVLPRLLLKQPDVFIVPQLVDGDAVKILCGQVNNDEKLVVTRIHAKEAVEALLRVLALNGPAQDFADAISFVLNSRLIRKLCENCKQAYQPQPQLLQKLGIPPGRVSHLYREFQMPPPEQRVDSRGRPVEIEICDKCGGIGYLGRTAIFELLEVSDEMKQALPKQPSLDVLRKLAKAAGHRSLQDEGVVAVAQGMTSLQELQRVLKQ